MPWSVTAQSGKCPASKPWAVVKDSDGTVEGCHPSQDAAEAQQAALYANERKDMTEGQVKARIAVKTAATATEAGAFSAIAAAYTIDRDKEFIRPGAFANTIKAWQGRNKPIPLHWAHQGDPESIIGQVDPHSMQETDAGLFVEGRLDIDNSDTAKEAWRLVKSDTIGLSFGFLGTMGEKSEDGTREIVEIDLFEVSLTPAPANPDTKILSWKSVDPPTEGEPTVKDLQEQLAATQAEMLAASERQLEVLAAVAGVKELPDGLKESLSEQERQILEAAEKKAEETARGRKARSVDPLLKESQKAELDRLTGGLDLPKPPDKQDDDPPEPLDMKRLRRESRQVMLDVLRS